MDLENTTIPFLVGCTARTVVAKYQVQRQLKHGARGAPYQEKW